MVLSRTIFFSSLIFSISFLSSTNIDLNLSNIYRTQWIMADLNYIAHTAGSIYAHENFLTKVVISNDNDFICTASCDKTVKIWDTRNYTKDSLKNHKLLATLGHPSWVEVLKITKDSKFILAGCKDGSVRVWDVRSAIKDKICKFDLNGHNSRVIDIKIDYEANTIATASIDGVINIWSLESGDLLKFIICYPDGEMDSFNRNKNYIFAAKTEDSIKIYDIENNYNLCKNISLENNTDKVMKIYSTIDFFVVVFQSGVIKIYDIKNFNEQYYLESSSKFINDYPCLNVAIGIDSFSNVIAYISEGDKLCIFNLNTNKIKELDLDIELDDEITCLKLSYDSNLILVGSRGAINLYNYQDNQGSLNNKLITDSCSSPSSRKCVGPVAISKDNKYIVSGFTGGKVKVYKVDQGMFVDDKRSIYSYNFMNNTNNTIDKFSDVIITTQ